MIRVETYAGTIPPPARAELRALESAFDYPLGVRERFRIDHGEDYGLFYSSFGESACVLARDELGACATVSAACRRLRKPGGAERPCIYGGDLKVHPRARGGTAYHRAATALASWASPKADCAYAVVMNGTAVTPESYSGRAGIPAFRRAAGVDVFRLETRSGRQDVVSAHETSAWREIFGDLTRQFFVPHGGDPASRTSTSAAFLLEPDGAACGRLEDTRRTKRLLRMDGSEIRAAHLAAFAFRSVESAAKLARRALSRAHAGGAAYLFFCVPDASADGLAAALADLEPTRAPAAVYAAGAALAGAHWIVSSSEI